MDEKFNMKFNYLLPSGTVIELKGGKHKLMINGHNVTMDKNVTKSGSMMYGENDQKPKIYNYCAVLWPEGDAIPGKRVLFNHDDIEKVYFTGFIDEDTSDLNDRIANIVKEINNKE
jgi:hypothetical protein